MTDAEGNISIPPPPILPTNGANQSQQQHQQFPQVRVAVLPNAFANTVYDAATSAPQIMAAAHQVAWAMAAPDVPNRNINAIQLPPLPNINAIIESPQLQSHAPHVGFAIPIAASTNNRHNTDADATPLPPLQVVQMQQIGTGGSGLSSVTNSVAATAASTYATQQSTPCAVASPSAATPDFSKPLSDENSLLSGDDSVKWDNEADSMFDLIDSEARKEAAEEDEDADMHGTISTVATELKLSKSGNKDQLFGRIRDSGSEFISNVTDTSFDVRRRRANADTANAFAGNGAAIDPNIPCWVLLNPEVPPPIPGINMATGAQDGFFGPTNKENASGAVWHNFITKESETLKRPQFAGKG